VTAAVKRALEDRPLRTAAALLSPVFASRDAPLVFRRAVRAALV
jgi:hypothetical protein